MTADPAQLIDRYLDGELATHEVASLEAALEADAALIDALAARAALAADLRRVTTRSTSNAERSDPVKPDPSPPRSLVRVPHLRFATRSLIFAAAAAALLIAAGAAAVYVGVLSNPGSAIRDSRSPVASVIDVSEGTLYIGDQIATAGDDYAGESITLDSGQAEFMLAGQVNVRLRGKTALSVHGPMSATLTHGTAEFDCPPSATGYTVHLPGGARVVDLGTAFALRVLANDAAVLQVTEGRVEAHVPGSSAAAIAAGRSVMIARTVGVVPMRRVNLDFNGPTSGTGSGGAVWGAAGDRWNALTVSPTPDSRLTESSYRVDGLADADGRATSVGFEMRKPDRHWRFFLAPDHAADAVRTDTIFLASSDNSTAEWIEWRITGLMPGVEYELAVLSQRQNGGNMHPTDFVVADGATAVLDASYHAVFGYGGPNGSVRADSAGEVRGLMRRRPDQKFAAWAGWQLHGPMPDAVSPLPHAPTPENPQPHE